MRNVERIADDLYLVKHPTQNGFVGVIAVLGKTKIGLIDTGFERTPIEYIFPFLKEMNRDAQEINYVVNTHKDGDHIGGNRVIKERTNAKIAIHEEDAKEVGIVDIELKDGDLVDLGDRTFMVIHTPGHTPGSICLYDEKNLVLISGDSICGERKNLIRMDKEVYISSLRKLLTLKIKTLVMAHPFGPLNKAVVSGEDAKKMIRASINIAESLD